MGTVDDIADLRGIGGDCAFSVVGKATYDPERRRYAPESLA